MDYGDLGSVPGYIEESFELITEGMLPFFEKGIVPVAMGGDHSVTLPELRACAKVNGPVALIHFDAHYDTIHEYFGKPYNHGTPFYHAAKEGLVDTSKSIQVGIREGLYGPEDLTNSTDLGYQVLRADECHKMGMEAVLKAIRARVGSAKAFLTFDIDFLDPAYAPGTGTPVPGGFTTAQALELVRGLADLNIVGYDVVEVSPPYDPTGITSIAAAGLMQEFISHVAYKKKNRHCLQFFCTPPQLSIFSFRAKSIRAADFSAVPDGFCAEQKDAGGAAKTPPAAPVPGSPISVSSGSLVRVTSIL